MELLFLGLVAWGIYVYVKNKNAGPQTEKPLVSPCDLPTCYSYILELLTESHRGEAWWSIRKQSPDEGKIVAMIQWREFFGDQLGEMDRRIVLTVNLIPTDDGKTEIYLFWEVHSPMHRGQVTETIDSMKAAVRANLSAY